MRSSDAPSTLLAGLDDEYNSSEDEDFNPDQQPGHNEDDDFFSSSDSEDEEDSKPARRPRKRKIKEVSTSRNDHVGNDSGDEAVISSAKSKRKKVKSEPEDEEGGEGGLIKTRAQRAREAKEKVPLSTTTASTVDVDALWKSLNTSSSPAKAAKSAAGTKSTIQTITTSRIDPAPVSSTATSEAVNISDEAGIQVATAEAITAVPLPVPIGAVLPLDGVESRTETTTTIPADKDGMVTIKRTYEFAGETITEEKQVPANSFEARAYLSSLQTGAAPAKTGSTPAKPLRRPMKKASKFDPGNASQGGKNKATKLNSLEKSRLDWAGYVDKEGIGDELDRQRRQGGDSYLERQDFLGRVGHRTGDRR